jgi:hypothetical protein
MLCIYTTTPESYLITKIPLKPLRIHTPSRNLNRINNI